MKSRYSWILGIVTVVCVGSIIVNGIQKVRYSDRIRIAETDAMEHVANQISDASSHMGADKSYFLAALAEAGGTLVTLQYIVPASQNTTRLELFNVGYYLHSQYSATSHNELTNFLSTANQLLQSHMVNGKYDITYLASDVDRLNQAIPKSGS